MLARAERWLASHDSSKAVKLTLLLRRSPLCDQQVWTQALQQLAQQVAEPEVRIAGLVARRFNRALGFASPVANAAAGNFDAIDEMLFASHDDLRAFIDGPGLSELTLPAELLDSAGSQAAIGSVTVLYQQPRIVSQPVKIITLPRRVAHMDVAQFTQYWVGVHGPLAVANPPTRERLWRSEFSPRFEHDDVPGYASCQYDGVGCIWFRDEAALKEEFRDSYYASVMAPDEVLFTDPSNSRVIPSVELATWWQPN
jgi:hypothetical protein